MNLIDTVEFFLDSNQCKIAEAFLCGLSQIIAVLGCRGAGKSGLIRAIILMLVLSGKKQVLYFSQSNSNSLDQFQKMIEDETVKGYLYSGCDKEPYTTKPVPTLRFSNAEVLFFSLEDNVSKRGFHPDALLCDECQSISQTAWSRIVYPMRVKMGSKWAPILCFGSTPETDGHWFYRLYDEGKVQPNERGSMSFTMDTNNSLAFKGEAGKKLLAEARANLAQDDFDSEFLLIPGGRGDTVFRTSDIDACVTAYNPNDVDWTFSRGTIMALDPALGRQDPMSMTISDLKGNIFYSHSIDKAKADTEQVAEVVATATKFKSLIAVESNSTAWTTYAGGLKLLVPYGVRGVPLRSVSTHAGEAKNLLCKQMAWSLEHRTLHINPQCVELIKQLKSIRDYKLPSGALRISAPDGQHDDEAFGAVIVCEALAKGWIPYLGANINPASRLL